MVHLALHISLHIAHTTGTAKGFWNRTWDPDFVNQPGVPEHHVARLHNGLGVEGGFEGFDRTSALIGGGAVTCAKAFIVIVHQQRCS